MYSSVFSFVLITLPQNGKNEYQKISKMDEIDGERYKCSVRRIEFVTKLTLIKWIAK